MAEREALSPAVFDAWNELWVGAALAHDRFMRIDVTERRDRGDALLGAGNSELIRKVETGFRKIMSKGSSRGR